MGGKAARTKGASGEREVIALISQYLGLECHRTPGSGNLTWMKGDVYGVPNLFLEVKRTEKLCIPAWVERMESQCPVGDTGLVVFRSSREPWRALCRFTDFLELWKLKMKLDE